MIQAREKATFWEQLQLKERMHTYDTIIERNYRLIIDTYNVCTYVHTYVRISDLDSHTFAPPPTKHFAPPPLNTTLINHFDLQCKSTLVKVIFICLLLLSLIFY